MLRKLPILLIISSVLFSCGTTKQASYADYVQGIKEKKNKLSIPIDSLNIVTPEIEIYNMVSNVSQSEYDQREIVTKFVIETLKYELNKIKCYDLALMSKDYLTINKVLERITYEKYKNPDRIVRAPGEILIEDKKYTLLISMTGYYGDKNSGVMYFSVINNKEKIIESVDRYYFNASPLNKEQTKQRIKTAISKIINM